MQKFMHGLNKVPKTIKLITMRKIYTIYLFKNLLTFSLVILITALAGTEVVAQDSTATPAKTKKKSYVKNTFEDNYLIDNQTVMVPVKGTLEFDINHRFGTTDHGFKDLFGLFSGANMRLGLSYTPIKNLQVGAGVNNHNMTVDANVKYALLRQTKDNSYPVSITYFGNIAMDTRSKNPSLPIVTTSDRFSFYNSLMVARKVTEAFSIQAAFNLTYFNNLEGYYDEAGVIQPKMKHEHLSLSFSGRYKITPKTSILVNYDQPLTQHPMNNPHPNLSMGAEFKTSGHAIQVFFGNYGYTLPQDNHFYNQNDYKKSQYVIGFNISRLWNF
jgi:Membrane bound beta barrel domain (DUF5777)